ncbi:MULTISPECIES: DNA polymerase IV [Clostridium]|uniref:DNA polymerase IV n=1 Tax=Clostridium disporicum TaxID=84024 RepID=A0A174LPG2_9CLOT|nr:MULTISPECIES: DNA polymerase IV [Clostridium]MCD2502456.1 DNA polymerase IV [Clostridium sp. NSJ-145]CUP23389.1 DNA polymerase IV [Clostridium disporicum]
MDKIILHVDMDAFFASVEQRDNPKLKGKPVIVGGVSERGVVSTCSYEARKYGVKSAMPIFMAQKLCPQGIYLRGRYWRYKEVSAQIFNIFREITPLVEPLSIDEAYLDITNSRFEDYKEAALYIKKRVYKEVGLTLSIGISYNKFLAKLASDWNKPNGIMVITEDMIPEILKPLSISKIYGLGQKSVRRLNNMGMYKIEDLYAHPKEFFIEYFGKYGIDIYNRIRGIDNRAVTPNRDRKSYGKETTLKSDTDDKEELKRYIEDFSLQISNYLQQKNIFIKTVTVKYKTSSFINHTRSKTLLYYINKAEDIYSVATEIIEEEVFSETIRLIGLTVSSIKEEKVEQLTLF